MQADTETASTVLTEDDFRHFDWASTTLGPAEGWSDPLKLWVEFMLPSVLPMFLLWGPDRLFLFNPAYSHLLGPRHREALGQPIEVIWKPIWPKVQPLVDEVFAGKSAMIEDYPMRTWRSDFTENRFFNLSYSPVFDLSRQVVGAACVVMDATHKVKQRQELLQTASAFQELYEQAPGFIAVVRGQEHRFVFANASYRQLVGHREVVGRTVAEVLPEIVDQGFIELLDEVYRTGEPFVARQLPIRLQRDSKAPWEERFVDTIYQPFRDARGEVVGIFAEGHDVTDQVVARHRVEALQAELLQVSRASAMGTMGAALAHELNQPLTAIANYMAAARRQAARTAPDPLLIEALDASGDAAHRAGEIIRSLRSMTAQGTVRKEKVSLQEAVEEAARLFSTTNHDVTILFDFASSEQVRADRVQLQQVILNLLQNASDAAKDGGRAGAGAGACTVKVSTKEKNGAVEICVSDSGPGIADHIMPNIFETFTTTKADGMGIGLSICRTIVEAHGGRIEARNNSGPGASICFTIPATTARSEDG